MESATETTSEDRRKERQHRYYLANKQKILAVNKAWWKAHPEKQREKDRRHYWAKHDKKRAAAARYRAANLEKVRKSRRDWQRNNWAHRQEYLKSYYAKNGPALKQKAKARYDATKVERREHLRRQSRESYQRNKPAALASSKRYRRKNKAKVCFWAQKRRALQLKATVNLTAIKEWMQKVRKKATAICYYCQKPTPTKGIHFDHIIALTKGGAHSVENLCVSCPACNLSKNNKPIRAWVRIGQQTLEL